MHARPFPITVTVLPLVLVLPLALLVAGRPAAAQDRASTRTIDVVVRDSASGAALAGARLFSVHDTARVAMSDQAGKARLEIPMRPADTIVVVRQGFRRYERALLNGGPDVLSFDVMLAPVVQELAEVRVEDRNRAGVREGRWAEFEHRRSSGSLGKFLTEVDIDRRRPVRMTDLFRGMAGVRVIDSASTRLVISNRGPNPSLISRSVLGGPCVLRVMIDGVLRGGLVNLDELDPREIHGIEIYVGQGSIPPSIIGMQRDAWCGLIVIWTK